MRRILFFLLFLFSASIPAVAFGEDVFWEYVCKCNVLPSDKKKEYALRSQSAFQAFAKTAELTPENLNFIRMQGTLRGIDFERLLWCNPDLDYDALSRICPQSAVLDTTFKIHKGLREGKDEVFFVDLFSAPDLSIREKIRLLGCFKDNGGTFSFAAKKKLWTFSEGDKLFRMFLFCDDKGEITEEYFTFLLREKELRYIIAERGNVRQIQRLLEEVGAADFWSNEMLVRTLLEERFGDVNIDLFLEESTLNALFSGEKRRTSCFEIFLSKYDFSSGKIKPETLIPFIKYASERIAIAFNPTISEAVRIPFFESLCFSDVFFRDKSNFSKNAQLRIIENGNLDAIRILLSCSDFDWNLFPRIKHNLEVLKCAILLNPDIPHSVRVSLGDCTWGKEELKILLLKSAWQDLPVEQFKTLYKSAQNDPSALKLLLSLSNLPKAYRKKIFYSLKDDPEIFAFADEFLDLLSREEVEKFCEKRLNAEAQSHNKANKK